jgi:hypothetical protein
MRPIVPENGYESPNEFPERRRHGYFSEGSEETHVGSTASSDANGVLGGMKSVLEGERAQATRKVAIRDRIGCHTWTWFTMVSCPKPSSIKIELTFFIDNGMLSCLSVYCILC